MCNAILTSWCWAHVLQTCRGTYRCDDTRGCVMQFWPPDDEHMCSKHVEAWNKTYCETTILCIKLVNYWDKQAELFALCSVALSCCKRGTGFLVFPKLVSQFVWRHYDTFFCSCDYSARTNGMYPACCMCCNCILLWSWFVSDGGLPLGKSPLVPNCVSSGKPNKG